MQSTAPFAAAARTFLGCMTLFLASCATLTASDKESIQATGPFKTIPELTPKATQADQALPVGWSEWKVLPHKRITTYRLVDLNGQPALRAEADRSASGLRTIVDIDPLKTPFLSFSWKVSQPPADADVSDRDAEDSATRVIIAFDGDQSQLDARERQLSEQARFLTGHPLPYATLMYVWSDKHPLETVVINPHSKRVRKIVVSNQSTPLNQWQRFRRNVLQDFEKAYGYRPSGRIKGVAILTDTDNTGERAVAFYGSIRLEPR